LAENPIQKLKEIERIKIHDDLIMCTNIFILMLEQLATSPKMNLPLFEKSYLSVDVIFEYFTE
jgi:hypothetical protein